MTDDDKVVPLQNARLHDNYFHKLSAAEVQARDAQLAEAKKRHPAGSRMVVTLDRLTKEELRGLVEDEVPNHGITNFSKTRKQVLVELLGTARSTRGKAGPRDG